MGQVITVEMKPTQMLVDAEVIIRAVASCETVIESSSVLLAEYDAAHERRTTKNRLVAEAYEREIAAAKRNRDEMRALLGWPELS